MNLTLTPRSELGLDGDNLIQSVEGVLKLITNKEVLDYDMFVGQGTGRVELRGYKVAPYSFITPLRAHSL